MAAQVFSKFFSSNVLPRQKRWESMTDLLTQHAQVRFFRAFFRCLVVLLAGVMRQEPFSGRFWKNII